MKLDNYEIKKMKHLNAELTRGCNLKCDYCFNSSGRRMPNELDTCGWKNVIDASINYGTKSALFTGGELMIRQDSPQIVGYSLEKGLETSILTNGFKLKDSRHFIEGLKRVQISLDSASPFSHDSRRGEGSWKVAREAIDYVRGFNVPVEISTTISSERLDELEGIAGIAYATGSRVLVRPMQQIGRALDYSDGNLNSSFDDKQQNLIRVFGDIFVEDFAKYVPIIGENHDEVVMNEGYVTVLPDGSIRGLNQKFLDLPLAA